MANEFVVTFEGNMDTDPLVSNFKIHNASEAPIHSVSFSGKTTIFPITWHSLGTMSGGNASIIDTDASDSKEVTHIYFKGFLPGETVSFTGGDFRFTGQLQSTVLLKHTVGARVLVRAGHGSYTGEFKVDNGTVKAIIPQDY